MSLAHDMMLDAKTRIAAAKVKRAEHDVAAGMLAIEGQRAVTPDDTELAKLKSILKKLQDEPPAGVAEQVRAQMLRDLREEIAIVEPRLTVAVAAWKSRVATETDAVERANVDIKNAEADLELWTRVAKATPEAAAPPA